MAVRGPAAETPAGDGFNLFRIGLDHLAIGCPDDGELRRVAGALAEAGVENMGITLDPALGRRYVAFKDPDRIAWEFYMAPDSARQAALSYFDGLGTGALDEIAFAADVRLESSVTPTLQGADATREFLRGVLPAIKDVRVDRVLVDGEQVAVRFELDTVYGVIPAFDFFRVVNGEIVEARPFYDPRPLTEAMQPAT